MAPHPNRQALTREALEQTAKCFRQPVFQAPESDRPQDAGRQQRLTQDLDCGEGAA